MTLRAALGRTLLLGDGAMGTMVRTSGLADVLNLSQPAAVLDIHRAYLAAGADWIETNTFSANLTTLSDFGLVDDLVRLNRTGAELARQAADEVSTPDWPRFVVGSMGPGSKLPTLGQAEFANLRDAYMMAAEALIAGGVDAIQVETCQDLLQAKAAIIGARRAVLKSGRDVLVVVCFTVEANGTMLLGTPVAAALAALRHLGVDAIGLNCATGPDLMAAPLRELSNLCPLPVCAMPNAGLPVVGPDGAQYPLGPDDFAVAMDSFAQRFGVSMVAGCCGTTPDHIAAARALIGRGRPVASRQVRPSNEVSSLYEAVDVHQDVSYLSVGERANVSGSKAFREAVLAKQWDAAIGIAKNQARSGAHLVDLCVDHVDGDGVRDMAELAARFATSVPQPVMLDSSKPDVLRVGLEHLPGRSVVNSVHLENAAKYRQTMTAVAEHGAAVVALTIDEEGLATTCERKLAVAHRLIDDITGEWGLAPQDIFVDLLTYPVTTGAADSRRVAAETIEAVRQFKAEVPDVGTILGISNVSFGLKMPARIVLNSVFLDECRQSGLDCAIVDAAKIKPLHLLPENQVQAARDLLWDDRTRADDPLAAYVALFDDEVSSADPVDELAALPLRERLVRRVVDAVPVGLEDDLDAALMEREALSIVNEDLLPGMQQVGELFGAGQLQLPFVLASAEVMKKALRHLEPALKAGSDGGPVRGTLVLATVAGDVHDIGKNLVDIIVSTNGYKVVNLGVRVPIEQIIEAAIREDATAIGLSGLLVKSAEVMREYLAELADRGLAGRFPVILGGAALSQSFVDGLRGQYPLVSYGADAFAALRVLESLAAKPVVASSPSVKTPRAARNAPEAPDGGTRRSAVARDVPVPQPPFWGARQVRGIKLGSVVNHLDMKALMMGRWGLRTQSGQSVAELVAANRSRLDAHLLELAPHLDQMAVAYGYWPAVGEGDELVLLNPGGDEIARFCFPRQAEPPYLCVADYFRGRDESGGPDVVALQLVTAGAGASQFTAGLMGDDRYRDYLEMHGLTVQLAEALAQMWHDRVRSELGLAAGQGERYSFGYPACPDLEQRQVLFDLVGGDVIGVSLSETFQLVPEQSTDALIVHHPEARYFSVR